MISKDKKYQTRDGHEVRIYEVYDDEAHGAIRDDYGWLVAYWNLKGICMDDDLGEDADLVEIPTDKDNLTVEDK